jgi:hypothetical protein
MMSWRAAIRTIAGVTSLGALELPCRGLGIAKSLKNGNFTLAKAVIRWMPVK